MTKLDIGCGRNKIDGATGMDGVGLPGVDIVHELNDFPWPIKNNVFDEIHCNHVLEHIDDVVRTMQEIYRISKNQAKIHIKVPHASCSKTVWTDPTHKRGFTCRTFLDYFSKDSKFGYYSNVNFLLISQKMNYCLYNGSRDTKIPRWWQSIWNYFGNLSFSTQEIFERIFANWIGGFEELEVELEVRK